MLDADARDRVIIALDCDRDRALELGHALAGKASWIKIGMTLYYAEGPAIVEEFKSLGFKVFLDLKFYDIPHQVEGAARSAALAGADLLSVHGSGASAMLRACREGAEQAATVRADRPRLVAITVLTSMDQDCLTEIGVDHPVAEQADRLARLAQASGIDGVVCSPREAAHMRELLGPDALVVTCALRAPIWAIKAASLRRPTRSAPVPAILLLAGPSLQLPTPLLPTRLLFPSWLRRSNRAQGEYGALNMQAVRVHSME